jgi:hypothetical protein
MEKIRCTDRVRNDVLHRVKEEENITHTHTHKEGRSNGLVTSCVATAFYNMLLNETHRERQQWREDEEERRKQRPDDIKEARE